MVTTAAPTPTSTLQRAIKAKALLHQDGAIQQIAATRYWVAASDGRGGYLVRLEHNGSCSCPDHQQRGVWCKHLQAAWEFDATVNRRAPEQRIRVQVGDAGQVTGWHYATAEEIDRQAKIAAGRRAIDELFPL